MTVLAWELQGEDAGLSSMMDQVVGNVDQWRQAIEALITSYNRLSRSSESQEQGDERRSQLNQSRALRIQQQQANLAASAQKVADAHAVAEARIQQVQARTEESQRRLAATTTETNNRIETSNTRAAAARERDAERQQRAAQRTAEVEQREAEKAYEAWVKLQAEIQEADRRGELAATSLESALQRTAAAYANASAAEDRAAQQLIASASEAQAAQTRQALSEYAAANQRTSIWERLGSVSQSVGGRIGSIWENVANRVVTSADSQYGVLNRLHERISSLGTISEKVGGGLKSFWDRALGTAGGIILYRAFDLVAQGIGAITSQIVEGPAKMEQYRTAFSNMVGGIEAANRQIAASQQFAVRTPFNLDDLLHYQQMLAAVGVQANDLLPLLRNVGDAVSAAGGGTDEMGKAVLAVTQIIARGKVSAQEMNQLANANVTAWRMLADFLGKTQAEVMKMAENGEISASVFMQAFENFSSKNYAGTMERQSRTFLGLMSNISDVGFNLGQTFGETAMNTITARLAEFVDWLTTPEVSATLADWGDKFGRVINLVFQLGSYGLQALQSFFTAIRPITDWLGLALGSLPADIDSQTAAYNRAAAAAGQIPATIEDATNKASENKTEIEAIQDAMRHLSDRAGDLRYSYQQQIDPLQRQLTLIERQYQLQNDQADLADLYTKQRRDQINSVDLRSDMGKQAREGLISDASDIAKKQREMRKDELENGIKDQIDALEKQRDIDLHYIDQTRNALADALDKLQDEAKALGTSAGKNYGTSFTDAVQEAWATLPEFGGSGAEQTAQGPASENALDKFAKAGGDAAGKWIEGFGASFKFDLWWEDFWKKNGPAFDFGRELMEQSGINPDTSSGKVGDLIGQWLGHSLDRAWDQIVNLPIWKGGPTMGEVFGGQQSGPVEHRPGEENLTTDEVRRKRAKELRESMLANPDMYKGEPLPANPDNPIQEPAVPWSEWGDPNSEQRKKARDQRGTFGGVDSTVGVPNTDTAPGWYSDRSPVEEHADKTVPGWRNDQYNSRKDRLQHPDNYPGQLLPANPYDQEHYPTEGPGWQNQKPPPKLGPDANGSSSYDNGPFVPTTTLGGAGASSDLSDYSNQARHYYGGGRGDGGPVFYGGSYTVGEHGPESFEPSENGTVRPMHADHGGGSYETVARCPDCDRKWYDRNFDRAVNERTDVIGHALGERAWQG